MKWPVTMLAFTVSLFFFWFFLDNLLLRQPTVTSDLLLSIPAAVGIFMCSICLREHLRGEGLAQGPSVVLMRVGKSGSFTISSKSCVSGNFL